MAEKELKLTRRRTAAIVATTLAIAGLLAAHARFAPLYPRHAFLSGWLLFVLVLFLTFFNLRKRVPFLRLGSATFWLQAHVYLGLFSGALFFVHIGWSWPAGMFDRVLAGCFALVFASGLLGLWISRVFPKRLTVAGFETPFELIAQARSNLRAQAEALVLKGVDGRTSPVIAEFFTRDLGVFFTRSCGFWSHLRQSRAPQAAHDARFDEVRRYVRQGERDLLEKLRDLVDRKHMLDYQHALQLAMRLWLFAHIPLSYALLVFSVFHIIIVHAFSGAAL